MKIAIVHKEHDKYDVDRPGGAAYVNMQIGRYLRSRHNHHVRFFYSGKNTVDEYGNMHENIENFKFSGDYFFDIIIGSCVIWPTIIKKSKSGRYCVLMHDRINKHDIVQFDNTLLNDSNNNIIICLSDSHAKTIRSLGYQYKNPIYVICNGYDSNYVRTRNFDGYDRFKIVYAAATNETKGLDLVLNAFPFIKGQIPEAELIICGDAKLHGSEKESVLERYKDEIRKNPSIKVKGFVSREELYRIYQTSGVYVAPTILEFNEPCPLGPIEAQANGLPVVASASGSLPELVEHKETGLIMKKRSVGELADSVIKIIKHREIWFRYVVKCMNTYNNKFHSWSNVAEKYNDLLTGDHEHGKYIKEDKIESKSICL